MKAKSIVGFISLFTLPTSMLAVVSCGPKTSGGGGVNQGLTPEQVSVAQLSEESAAAQSARSTNIKVAVRTEDLEIYKAIANKFNAFGLGSASIVTLGNNPSAYLETAAPTNSVGTIFISDLNSNLKIKTKDLYAKPFVLDDVFSSKNSALYNVDPNNLSYTSNDFTSEEVFSNKNGVSFAMPLGYGLRGIIANTWLLRALPGFRQDATTKEISFDPITINDYVPSTIAQVPNRPWRQLGIEKLEGAGHETRISNVDDIQAYINKAGDSSSRPDTNNRWLGYGPGSMFQRIFSVGQSLKAASQGKLDGVSIMPLKENLNNFGLLVSYKNGVLDENGVLTKNKFENELFGGGQVSQELAQYLWDSYGGYMYHIGSSVGFMTSDYINGDSTIGEVEPLQHSQTMFNFNAKWAARMVNDSWKTKNLEQYKNDRLRPSRGTAELADGTLANDGQALAEKQLSILSVPYGDIAVADSLAISKTATAAETLVAKRFLKYLYQLHTDITYPVSGKDVTEKIGYAVSQKFVSANIAINTEQKKRAQNPSIEDAANQPGWYNMGLKDGANVSDNYNGVSGSVWKIVDSDYLDTFENNFWPQMQKFYGLTPKAPIKWTFDQFKAQINLGISSYNNQMRLS